MSGAPERRSAAIEVRAKGRRLEGHAALWNTEARIGDSFVEVIKPGAFARSLAGDLLKPVDILALVDHDPSWVLARTRSRTLRLSEDTRGLALDLDVPPTTLGNDILALAERGDLGGMSFGFRCAPGGDHWQGKRRELRAVDLIEISVIHAHPAYPDTIVSARSATGRGPSRVIFARRWLDTFGGSP